MRTTLFALTAISAVAAFNPTAADAANRAVCIHGSQTGGVYDCSYDSIAQCNASASGTASFCDVNPEYIARGYNPQNAYDQQYSPTPRRGYRNRYSSGY